MRSMSVSVTLDSYEMREVLQGIDTKELVEELKERAQQERRPDEVAREALGGAIRTTDAMDADWPDVERALVGKDWDWIERWLWPQVRAVWPKPRTVPVAAAPLNDSDGKSK